MGNGRSKLSKSVKSSQTTTTNIAGTTRYKEYTASSVEDAANYYANVERISPEDATRFGLNGSQHFQTLVHALGLHDKPIVLTDADYDRQVQTEALDGVELYRGVGTQRSVNSTMFSNYTYIGDGIHGDGLYFSTSIATAYGYGGATMTGYIDKTMARPIKESSLRAMLGKESSTVRATFRGDSGLSAYALYKGYNVIHVPGGNAGSGYSVQARGRTSGEDYYVPLIRDIIVFREHTRKRR